MRRSSIGWLGRAEADMGPDDRGWQAAQFGKDREDLPGSGEDCAQAGMHVEPG